MQPQLNLLASGSTIANGISSFPSSSATNINLRKHQLATFEEGLRRLVIRQKRVFLVYDTILGILLLLFYVSTVNVLFNFVVSIAGVEATVARYLPGVFSCSGAAATLSMSSSLLHSIHDIADKFPEAVSQQIEQFVAAVPKSRLKLNEPLNFFCGIRLLAPIIVCVAALSCSVTLFLVVRGVFALRRPDKYLAGLNESLLTYAWRFDERIGKLVALTKMEKRGNELATRKNDLN